MLSNPLSCPVEYLLIIQWIVLCTPWTAGASQEHNYKAPGPVNYMIGNSVMDAKQTYYVCSIYCTYTYFRCYMLFPNGWVKPNKCKMFFSHTAGDLRIDHVTCGCHYPPVFPPFHPSISIFLLAPIQFSVCMCRRFGWVCNKGQILAVSLAWLPVVGDNNQSATTYLMRDNLLFKAAIMYCI